MIEEISKIREQAFIAVETLNGERVAIDALEKEFGISLDNMERCMSKYLLQSIREDASQSVRDGSGDLSKYATATKLER